VAEPVAELGHTYVGIDLNERGLAEVAKRGFETHVLDLRLGAGSIEAALRTILAGRPLAAVLALDVLEHLPQPDAVLGAARVLAAEREGATLVTSLPNVTHFDVAAKLMVGRWDLVGAGLLDDTHLHLVGERGAHEMVAAAGWRQVDADDIVSDFSDQLFPPDLPVLRPGLPLQQVLWGLRGRAEAHRSTFQFVRRWVPAPNADARAHGPSPVTAWSYETPPLLGVVIDLDLGHRGDGPAELDGLLSALVQQEPTLGDLVVIGRGAEDAVRRAVDVGLSASAAGSSSGAAALASLNARWGVVLGQGDRPSPGWAAALAAVSEDVPGQVLRSSPVVAGRQDGVSLHAFDLAHADAPGIHAPAAFALPVQAVRVAMGAAVGGDEPRIDHEGGLIGLTALVAMWCSVVPVPEARVVCDPTTLTDAEQVVSAELAALESVAVVLPPGAAGRLRRSGVDLAGLRADAGATRGRLAHLEAQADVMAHHLAGAEEHIASLTHQVDLMNAWAARRPEARLRRLVRRVLRG
jgi:hypothetical protein